MHADLKRIFRRKYLKKKRSSFAFFASWYGKINNELVLTRYELTVSEFVSVRLVRCFFHVHL